MAAGRRCRSWSSRAGLQQGVVAGQGRLGAVVAGPGANRNNRGDRTLRCFPRLDEHHFRVDGAHLYAPDAGRILWDDLDTRTCHPFTVRQSIAVIFQDFVRYLLSARENIGAGRHERFDDLEGITRAARWSGADPILSRLPKGYDTPLGKEFTGGLDLSIGQWQRVALARAFFRDAPFVILDKPTAALDPRAEYELFQRIGSLFQGRSVLLISHRFSSVCSADRIYVLKDGKVVEHGRHEDLMATGGIYSELFTLQASVYLQVTESRPASAMDLGSDSPGGRLATEDVADRTAESSTHSAVTWTGAVLLPALAEGATREELATLVSDRFHVDRHQAVRDVDSLLAELEAQRAVGADDATWRLQSRHGMRRLRRRPSPCSPRSAGVNASYLSSAWSRGVLTTLEPRVSSGPEDAGESSGS